MKGIKEILERQYSGIIIIPCTGIQGFSLQKLLKYDPKLLLTVIVSELENVFQLPRKS